MSEPGGKETASSDPLARAPKPLDLSDSQSGANVRPVVPAEQQSWYSFKHVPCFRETLMYSVATSTMFGILEISRKKKGVQVGNTVVGSFSAVAIGAWLLCRYQVRQRHEQLVHNLKFEQNAKRMEALGPANAQAEEK